MTRVDIDLLEVIGRSPGQGAGNAVSGTVDDGGRFPTYDPPPPPPPSTFFGPWAPDIEPRTRTFVEEGSGTLDVQPPDDGRPGHEEVVKISWRTWSRTRVHNVSSTSGPTPLRGSPVEYVQTLFL